MSCYTESDSHITDKVKVLLDLSNYFTKKELEHTTGIDTSGLAAKKGLIKCIYIKNWDKLYQLLDQFNETKINHRDFYYALLNNIHPFYDWNGRTCKILFVSNFN